MKHTKTIIVLIITILCIAMTSCSGQGDSSDSPEAKAAYAAYEQILLDSEGAKLDINKYAEDSDFNSFQRDYNGNYVWKPAALRDVTGDGVPEFFLVEGSVDDEYYDEDDYYEVYAETSLRIFTYKDGAVHEINNSDNSIYSPISDVSAVLFAGKNNELISCSRWVGGTVYCESIDVNRINEEGKIICEKTLSASFQFDYEDLSDEEAEYSFAIDNKEVDFETYDKELKSVVDLCEEAIIFSSSMGGFSGELFETLNSLDEKYNDETALEMSYDDMLKFLQAHKADETTVNPAEDNKQDVNEAYKNILKENEDTIQAYTWQNEFVNDVPEYGPAALCDIDEDGIPELFFVSANNEYYARLNIFTYKDGKAKELAIDATFHSSVIDDKQSIDENVASGATYLVYKCKEPGRFNIYHGIGDEGYDYTMQEYRMSDNGIEKIGRLEDNYYLDWDDEQDVPIGYKDKWYKNDKRISEKEFLKEWTATREDMDTDNIILFSGWADDVSHFKLLREHGALCMPYDKMIQKLTK